MSEFRTFDDRSVLTSAASELIASTLRAAVKARGEAFLALSGGSTPGPIYERLARSERTPWSKVRVTLADERLAPGDSGDRNEDLLRKTLFQHQGANAGFEPLTDGKSVPTQDLILLGMGDDGHFASLFPTAPQLGEALGENAPDVMRIAPHPLPDNAPYERLSLTLPAILRARSILLVLTGQKKREVYQQAERSTPRTHPINALLRAEPAQLITYWAP